MRNRLIILLSILPLCACGAESSSPDSHEAESSSPDSSYAPMPTDEQFSRAVNWSFSGTDAERIERMESAVTLRKSLGVEKNRSDKYENLFLWQQDPNSPPQTTMKLIVDRASFSALAENSSAIIADLDPQWRAYDFPTLYLSLYDESFFAAYSLAVIQTSEWFGAFAPGDYCVDGDSITLEYFLDHRRGGWWFTPGSYAFFYPIPKEELNEGAEYTLVEKMSEYIVAQE